MVSWLIGSAVRLRRLVVAGVVAVLALGLVQLQQATVDVYPEYEPTVVQVQTEALGLSALEVEQLITVPLEQNLLNGIPRLAEIRSRSMSGLSVVDLAFETGTELYLARQLVQERMARSSLLPKVGHPPTMIQATASASRVAMVGMRSDDVPLIEMSVLAQWHMRPRLMSIPGVANVSIWGLRDRQLQVRIDPERLVASNVTLTQLITTTGNALWVSPLSFVQASTPGTGGFLESPNQRIGVQHVSPVTDSGQLADVTVQRADGAPVRLGDVADVREDHPPLIGDASSAGEQGLVLVVERFPDADTAQVGRDVEAALEAMAPGLSGITLDPTVYQPRAYLDTALGRLGLAVLIGLLLAFAVVLVVSSSWRVAVIAVVSVATSLVGALYVLHLRDTTLTTMTVVGLAAVTALVVDDAVGDALELRARFDRRREAGDSPVGALVAGALVPRRGALAYATVVVLVAVTPLLLLSGTAGAFARPAVLSFALAALLSLLVALVVTPTLAVALLGGRGARPAPPPRSTGWVHRGVDRLAPSVGRRGPAVVALVLLLGLGVVAGVQFRPDGVLPEPHERNVLVRLEAAPGTSLGEMDRITGRAAGELRGLPGVESAATHVGRAVGGDAVVDVDAGEIWLAIGEDADHAATLDAIRATVAGYPGLAGEVRSYVQGRLASAGDPRGDELVVRVYGQDFGTIRETADMVQEALATVEGVVTPVVEPQPRQPVAEVRVDLDAAQQYGVKPGDVRRAASTVVSGLVVGSLYEQQAIFEVVVWGDAATRQSILDIEALLIDTPSGAQVPLGAVADVVQTSDPTVITHDAVSRSLDVTARVQGRDRGEVSDDVTTRLQELSYPYEYRAEVIDDAGDRADVQQWLVLAVLVVVGLVFLLLQAATSSWRGAAALVLCLPLAGVGGLAAGTLLGSAGSLPVLAAIASAVALAVRQALVLVRRAQALAAGTGVRDATAAMRRAVEEKAPAVVVVVLTTAAAFLPAAVVPRGAGLELLGPFAVTLLAGLVTSTLVVLVLVPALLPAVGALTPTTGGPDDVFAGRHEAREDDEDVEDDEDEGVRQETGPRRADGRPGTGRERGSTVMTSSPARLASFLVAAGLVVTGCSGTAQGTDAAAGEEPAVLEVADDGEPGRITLTREARDRIGLETEAVATSPDGLSIPYGGVVYDNEGEAWTFAVVGERTYQRAPISILDIVDDRALLGAGPAPGTEVVTVGAALLVGVEAGISGGE